MSADRNEGRRQRLLQFASAALFLTIVGVAVLIVLNTGQTDGGDTQLEDVGLVKRQLAGIPQRDMTLGDSGAKVTLIEFGDLKCPVCRAYAEDVMPGVIDSKVRSGVAKIDFRNYPIIDDQSQTAGAAALAAGRQGRGWSFVEIFYRNQGNESDSYADDAFLTAIAKAAGVRNIARWNRERLEPNTIALVSTSTGEALRLGFDGTPSFVVDGPGNEGLEKVETTAGSPQEQLEEAIDGAE